MDAFIDYLRSGGGVQKAMAKQLGVSSGLVWQWAHRYRPIAAHHCRAIERATAGRFRAETLRPDVFQPAAVQEQAAA